MPHGVSRRASGTTQPRAPLRCPGGEDTPPEASEAPAREAREAEHNELMGTARLSGQALRKLPRQLSRFRIMRYRNNSVVPGRAPRELAFCAIEGPLGVLVLAVLAA